jgi:hypothetical protein
MKNIKMEQSRKRLFFKLTAVLCLLIVGLMQSAQAQTITFAQFFEQNGTQDFQFVNNISSANFQTIPGGSPILFQYQNVLGLPAELAGPQQAHLYLSASATTPATLNGTQARQNLQSVTIQIIRDTPATIGNGTRTNLLTATVTAGFPAILGDLAENSASLLASTPTDNITFTSDFLIFSGTSQRNFGLSFSSITPALSIGPGGFLQSFISAGTGTFAANTSPVCSPCGTTAATVTVSGRVTNSEGRAISKAMVILTEANGIRHVSRTNGFGYYVISEVEVGQTVTVEVAS